MLLAAKQLLLCSGGSGMLWHAFCLPTEWHAFCLPTVWHAFCLPTVWALEGLLLLLLPLLANCLATRALPTARLLASFRPGSALHSAKLWLAAAAGTACRSTLPVADPSGRVCGLVSTAAAPAGFGFGNSSSTGGTMGQQYRWCM